LKEQQPMLERAEQFITKPSVVRDIVHTGTLKARAAAQETMKEVRDAMGLSY